MRCEKNVRYLDSDTILRHKIIDFLQYDPISRVIQNQGYTILRITKQVSIKGRHYSSGRTKRNLKKKFIKLSNAFSTICT